MSRWIVCLALAVGSMFAAATASFADCRPEINVTGTGALTESRAQQKAIDAWRNQAISSHGVFYGEADKANDGKGVTKGRCARSLLGLQVCQVSGRPCSVPTESELACIRNEDPPKCDPTVKWVQSRLNEKTRSKLKVDGVPGSGTERAIVAFRKAQNIPGDDEIDEKLITALK